MPAFYPSRRHATPQQNADSMQKLENPRPVPKFPKIPVPKITPKLHSAGLQTATFYNRSNYKEAKSVL